MRELDRLQALGVANLRVMAASEGPDRERVEPARADAGRVVPAMQPAPCVYNRAVIAGIACSSSSRACCMTAVLVLGNMWPWSGGFAQYVRPATACRCRPPGARGAFETARYVSFAKAFFNTKDAKTRASDTSASW